MSNAKKTAADFVPEGSVVINTVLHDPDFVPFIPAIETWRDAPVVKATRPQPTKPAESATKKEN